MKKTLPPLEPVGRVAARHARLARSTAGGAGHVGLPVPVPGPDGMRLAMLAAVTEPAKGPGALRLQAPTYLVSARADTGDFAELKAIAPQDLVPPPGAAGAKDAQDAAPWLGEIPAADALGDKRARLFELLDAALPVYATGRAAVAPSVKRAAREIRELWGEVAEPPLAPYYRALGRRFFEWIDRAAAA
jgi:hypothetical protein